MFSTAMVNLVRTRELVVEPVDDSFWIFLETEKKTGRVKMIENTLYEHLIDTIKLKISIPV